MKFSIIALVIAYILSTNLSSVFAQPTGLELIFDKIESSNVDIIEKKLRIQEYKKSREAISSSDWILESSFKFEYRNRDSGFSDRETNQRSFNINLSKTSLSTGANFSLFYAKSYSSGRNNNTFDFDNISSNSKGAYLSVPLLKNQLGILSRFRFEQLDFTILNEELTLKELKQELFESASIEYIKWLSAQNKKTLINNIIELAKNSVLSASKSKNPLPNDYLNTLLSSEILSYSVEIESLQYKSFHSLNNLATLMAMTIDNISKIDIFHQNKITDNKLNSINNHSTLLNILKLNKDIERLSHKDKKLNNEKLPNLFAGVNYRISNDTYNLISSSGESTFMHGELNFSTKISDQFKFNESINQEISRNKFSIETINEDIRETFMKNEDVIETTLTNIRNITRHQEQTKKLITIVNKKIFLELETLKENASNIHALLSSIHELFNMQLDYIISNESKQNNIISYLRATNQLSKNAIL